MSRLQQLMRMEIGMPSGEAALRALNWLREGLGVFLPDRLRRSGWRARRRLIYLSPEQMRDQSRVVETSWFGESRLGGVSPGQGDAPSSLPGVIVLHPETYFTMHLSLPAEAAGSFAKAVKLRLGEISPIPPEDAAFAVGRVRTDAAGRAYAQVAITKKRYLREIADRYDDVGVSAIGAAPGGDGAPAFIFLQEDQNTPPISRRRMIDAAMLAAALLFLIVAIDIRQQNRLQTFQEYEARTLSELRALRPLSSLLSDIDAAALDALISRPISGTRDSAVNTIDNALAALPDEAIVTQVRLNHQAVSLSGFVPTKTSPAPNANVNFSTTASNRPGFDRFELTKPLGSAP